MITITADHEGGCLDRYVKCGEGFYALVLRPDTWYYFNFKITGCKDKELIFQFDCYPHLLGEVNEGRGRWYNQRDNFFYTKPVISYDNGKTWEQAEDMFKVNSKPGQYIFSHTFKQDEAIVGYAPTYLYSDLLVYLDKLCQNSIVKRSDIGKSRCGVIEPRLTITKNPDSKKVFVLISREDADEVTGSTALEGALDWLTSGDERAEKFLREYRLECIPMVCVDGVIAGATHSAGYGYGGYKWHLEKSPKEIQNVKDFLQGLHEQGDKFVLAAKLHGGMTYAKFPIDYYSSTIELDRQLKGNKFGFWQPLDIPNSIAIRPKGYFERHMLDTYDLKELCAVHVNGETKEFCYGCGRDLMINFVDYLNKKIEK